MHLKQPTREPCGPHVVPLFGLAPSGVYHAVECYHRRGALLPHHFNLTGFSEKKLRRYIFCCTFRRLAPPRCYLAPCPVEPGLSSLFYIYRIARLPGQLRVRVYSIISYINQPFSKIYEFSPFNVKAC